MWYKRGRKKNCNYKLSSDNKILLSLIKKAWCTCTFLNHFREVNEQLPQEKSLKIHEWERYGYSHLFSMTWALFSLRPVSIESTLLLLLLIQNFLDIIKNLYMQSHISKCKLNFQDRNYEIINCFLFMLRFRFLLCQSNMNYIIFFF